MKLIRFQSDGKFTAGVLFILLVALAVNWEACRSGRIGSLLYNLATPRSGEKEVLPERVQFVANFLRANHVKSISISPVIANNRFIAQPLTEGVYPIVVKDSAEIFVSYSSEAIPIGFVTLRIEKGVRIAGCR